MDADVERPVYQAYPPDDPINPIYWAISKALPSSILCPGNPAVTSWEDSDGKHLFVMPHKVNISKKC